MRAHVDTNPMTGRTRIWIYQAGIGDEITYLTPDGSGGFTSIAIAAAAEPPEPMFELPREAAEALASALGTLGRPEDATLRHLNDAIAIRDRLLALVEQG